MDDDDYVVEVSLKVFLEKLKNLFIAMIKLNQKILFNRENIFTFLRYEDSWSVKSDYLAPTCKLSCTIKTF